MISDTRVFTVALVALLVLGSAAPAAAAQESGSEQDDDLLPSIDEIKGLVDGIADRVANAIQTDRVLEELGLTEEPATADEAASALDSYVGVNEGDLTAYANEHLGSDVELRRTDVVQVHLQSPDEQRTVFVVGSVAENGSLEAVDVVNETDRSVDFTVTLDEYATRHLSEEISDADERYVQPSRSPDGLRTSLLAEYSGHVTIEEGDAPAATN